MFWRDAEEFRNVALPEPRSLALLARVIHRNYIAPGAPYDVGLSQEARAALCDLLATPIPTMYNVPQLWVRSCCYE